jgi:hypothetical protein
MINYQDYLTESKEGKIEKYQCIKEFCDKYHYNYSTVKSIYRNGNQSKKYGFKIVNG